MIILFILSTCLSTGRGDVFSKKHLCRVSSDAFYDEKAFASFACGQCFYYTFLLPYRLSYVTENCPNGVLICPKSKPPREIGRQNCTCRSEKFVYNLRGYGSSRGSLLEDLSMKPSLPKNFVQLTRDCCKAAEKCCQAMMGNEKISVNEPKFLECPQLQFYSDQGFFDPKNGVLIASLYQPYTKSAAPFNNSLQRSGETRALSIKDLSAQTAGCIFIAVNGSDWSISQQSSRA
uniref:Uncharacterized protein n=1 Tax=Romanomermis culicivorax TaxID=13658 RepID=A0A915KCZ0_ROMCU